MNKLTKRVVDAAEIRVNPYFIWCEELPGFGMRIYPSKKRVYYVDYRNSGGARKRMTLGTHGKLTTEEARKLAIATMGDVIRGEDPAEERATRRKSMTVEDLCDRYLAAADRGLIMGKRGLPKKASTLDIDRGRIKRHIVPLLGGKLVSELTQADVAKFIRDIASGKTAANEATKRKRGRAIVKGGMGTAARTVGLLGGILSFARAEGVVTANPTHGVKKPADGKRTRRLSPEEFAALGSALTAAQSEGEQWQAVTMVRLLALTGLRRGEAVKLKWAEVDLAGRAIRLADSKEGASVRPIGGAVVEMLATLPRRAGGVYVMPASRQSAKLAAKNEAPFGGVASSIERLMARAGLAGVTAHTLRHSYASTAGDLGYAEPTIAALLGHAAGSITSRYIHHLDAVLIAAADRVARTIALSMVAPKAAGESSGNIVRFRPRASG